MNLDYMISFCGWAALTYLWLHTNFTFFEAIDLAIQYHNHKIREATRHKAFQAGWDACTKIYIRRIENDSEEEEEEEEEEDES